MALLSIVVPVYNIKEYLPACVESIRGQTFADWELILVDDGSRDGSGCLCDTLAETDPRIRVIHQENGGVSRARNAGVRAASGKYLAFVDGDDFIHHEMYGKLIAPMEQGCDIVFCRFLRSYEDRNVPHYEENLSAIAERPWDYSKIVYEFSYGETETETRADTVFGSVCRSLFRTELIKERKIQFPEDVKIAEDRLFLLEYLAYCEKGMLVDDYLYYYRADRTTSATAQGTVGYQPNLYLRRREQLARERELICRNSRLTKKEKKDLIVYENYRLAQDVALNEVLNNKDYKEKLRRMFREEPLRSSIKVASFIHMGKTGVSLKRMALYVMIKGHRWNLLKKMLKGRRRNV